ncbi:TadE/TadG family type IV pilus assembly protein [Methylocystis sp. JAN1]|uniref:TadE/TadG family type IV pilus assembly protein n=1 Tax=Methylocystis sp. JAN1 TaxID=3397211 RepID=UPI003FA1CEF7
MAKTLASKVLSDTSGAVLAEFAAAVLTLIIATFGVIDMGLFLWTDVTLNRATHAAARCRTLDQTNCGSDSDAQAYAVAQSWGAASLTAANYTVGSCTSGTLPGVQVQGTYTYSFITPGVGPTALLSHTACYPRQY